MVALLNLLKETFGAISVGSGYVRVATVDSLPADIQAMVDDLGLYCNLAPGDRTHEPCTFIRRQKTSEEQVDIFND